MPMRRASYHCQPATMNAPEEDRRERKSTYEHDAEGKAMLVRTIVAMANTRGGELHLERVSCKAADLDSARLDDLVNRFVAPRIGAISSEPTEQGGVVIRVEDSDQKPHVFTDELKYEDKRGKERAAFHRGQILVRHSTKTEPADGDDVDKILRFRIGRFLRQLSVSVNNHDIPLRLTDDEGLPIHLVEGPDGQAFSLDPSLAVRASQDGQLSVRLCNDPGAPAVRVEVAEQYPYTTGQLAAKLGTSMNQVARAAKALRLKEDPTYHREISTGRSTIPKYSDAALARLKAKWDQDPAWNPWKDPPS